MRALLLFSFVVALLVAGCTSAPQPQPTAAPLASSTPSTEPVTQQADVPARASSAPQMLPPQVPPAPTAATASISPAPPSPSLSAPPPAPPTPPSAPAALPQPPTSRPRPGVDLSNLIDRAAWEYSDKAVRVANGHLVVAAGGTWATPVNLALRFKVQGDWSLTASLENSSDTGGGVMLVGALARGEWWQGLKRLEVIARPGNVTVKLRMGQSPDVALSRSFKVAGLGARAELGLKKAGRQLTISVNGTVVGQVDDLGIFDNGALYLGVTSSPANRLTVTRLALAVAPGQEGAVKLDLPTFPASAASPASAPAAPARPATLTLPTEQAVLATLRPEHPRLVALDDDLARLRETISFDPVAALYYARLKNAGEGMLTQPPVHRTTDVHDVAGSALQTSRLVLERVYTLALLYRVDGDRRWAERAKEEMLTAAGLPDWNPGHFLDVAEMSHALAIGYDWLYDALSASDRAKIRDAIVTKGLMAAEHSYRTKEWWTTSTSNWNVVCNGGIAIAALAVADTDQPLSRRVLARALASLRAGLTGYAADGAYPEGPGYWSYATRYLVPTLAALESALGTDFGFGSAPGLAKTGLYRLEVVGPTGVLFNYADSGTGAAWNGDEPSLFWLSRRYGQPLLAWAAREAAAGRMGSGGHPASIPMDLLWYDPGGSVTDLLKRPLDAFYGDKNVAVLRSSWDSRSALFVGFKGGDNKDGHSQLELGSFVFDALGQRWAVDLGSDDYALPGYFADLRWTYYRMKTEGNNTITLDGKNQDPKAEAPLVSVGSTAWSSFAIADLSAAYAPSGAKRVRRGVALVDDRSRLIVQDEIEAVRPVEVAWTMHTRALVEVQGDHAILTQGGAVVQLQVLGPAGARFALEQVSIRPPQVPASDVRKLVVRLPEKTAKATVVVVITPAGKAPLGVSPLDDWPTLGPVRP